MHQALSILFGRQTPTRVFCTSPEGKKLFTGCRRTKRRMLDIGMSEKKEKQKNLKISSLLQGRAILFFIIMFEAPPLKREPFSKTLLQENPFPKKSLETALFLKKKIRCYSFPVELLQWGFSHGELFSTWLLFLQRSTILTLLKSQFGIWCYC